VPLNPELPDDVKNKAELFVMQHSVAIADVGLVIALAVVFTILGTPLVSLGLILGVAVVLSVGAAR
jgi:hypothetical protein